MSVWELYTQLFATNKRCGRFARSLSLGRSEKIRKKDVVITAGRWLSWSIRIPQFLMLWWPTMKAGSTAMTQRPRDRVPSGSMLALPDPRGPDRANPPTNFWWSIFYGMFYMHWVPTGQTVYKEYYVEVLRKFSKKFRRKRPELFKSGQWHFHQDNAPVHNSILVTDYLTKMGIKRVPQPPIVQILIPVTFGYSQSLRGTLEAVVMRQLRRWNRLWRRSLTRSHKRTSMEPSRICWNGTTSALQPEEITSKRTTVSSV